MQINAVNLNFGHKSNKKTSAKNSTFKNKQEVSQFFLDADKVTKALFRSQEEWDKLYSLSLNDSLLLANAIKLTYKNYNDQNPYSASLIRNPQTDYLKLVKELIMVDEILDNDKQEKFLNKTKGAYKLEEIKKYNALGLEKSDEIKDNLNFINILEEDENKEVFDAMSPATLVGILYNRYLSFDDFVKSLNLIYEDGVLDYPKDEIRETIHEYLLGESYFKISSVEEFDKMFSGI